MIARLAAPACFALLALVCTSAAASTLTVTNVSDSGAGSLRAALGAAAVGDTIVFSTSGSIALATPLSIGQSVTINGPGAGIITLSGQSTVQVITLTAGTLTLSGVTIANGKLASSGGGIGVAAGANLSVSRTVFNSNSAGNGGAISVTAGATLAVDESTFAGNTTTGVGGGAIINFGTATISNSTFANNRAPINGGAVNTQPAGTTTVVNSTFAGNTSAGLGGATSNLGTTNLLDSTFSGNTGSSGSVLASGNANVLVNNDVFADNPGGALNPSGAVPGNNNVFFNNGANDATGDGTTNFIFAAAEPLGTFGTIGGPTQTQLPLAGGAAICAGAIGLLPAGLTRDQRGLARTSPGCLDAGAVQFSQPAAQPAPALSPLMLWILGALVAGIGFLARRTPVRQRGRRQR